MQRAIRWAVCLVIAATSTPVFADGDDAAKAQPPQDQVTNAEKTNVEKTNASAADDTGSGGAEPTSLAPRAPQSAAGDDAAAPVQHDEFVAQIWNSP